jgi:hypothetical protein
MGARHNTKNEATLILGFWRFQVYPKRGLHVVCLILPRIQEPQRDAITALLAVEQVVVRRRRPRRHTALVGESVLSPFLVVWGQKESANRKTTEE